MRCHLQLAMPTGVHNHQDHYCSASTYIACCSGCTFTMLGVICLSKLVFAPTLQFRCRINSTQWGRCSAAMSTMNHVHGKIKLHSSSCISPVVAAILYIALWPVVCLTKAVLPFAKRGSVASTPAGCCYHSSTPPVRLGRVASCFASSTTCLALCRPQDVSCHWQCVYHAKTVALLPTALHIRAVHSCMTFGT